MIKGYGEKIESELARFAIFDVPLVPSAASGKSKVFSQM
jgi:hypothetical protein